MTTAPPQQALAVAKLRDILKPGDTVRCIGRHTSRSGASRSLSAFVQIGSDLIELDCLASLALDLPADRKHGGIRVYTAEDGVHVDAAAELVSRLAGAVGYPLRHAWL